MGCDGGTIPKRHELVRTKQKPEEKDKDADLAVKWQYCTLSNHMLKEPIVACELGKLYNKDAIIEYLLDKQAPDKPEKVSHIKSLKDIYTLTLCKNQAWSNSAEKGDGYIDTHKSKYICPVAGIEMNGKYSERALKQMRGNLCPSCSKEYVKENDVILLNGSEPEVEKLKNKMEERKVAAKAAKQKSKKLKSEKKDVPKTKIDAVEKGPSTSGTSSKPKNLSTCSSVQGAKHKLNEEKIFQTETFKSLFTSHSSAKRAKDKNGHWITYNPYHYAG